MKPTLVTFPAQQLLEPFDTSEVSIFCCKSSQFKPFDLSNLLPLHSCCTSDGGDDSNCQLFLFTDIQAGCETGKPFHCVVSNVHVVKPEMSDPLEEHSMTRIDLDISILAQVEPLQACVM